jgi:hypothetical protein
MVTVRVTIVVIILDLVMSGKGGSGGKLNLAKF